MVGGGFILGSGGWWGMMVGLCWLVLGLFWVVVGGGRFILVCSGWWWGFLGGGGWWRVYFGGGGWWTVFSGWWWMMVCIFSVVGIFWVVVGGATVYNSPYRKPPVASFITT